MRLVSCLCQKLPHIGDSFSGPTTTGDGQQAEPGLPSQTRTGNLSGSGKSIEVGSSKLKAQSSKRED
jgi:hypothetical protein